MAVLGRRYTTPLQLLFAHFTRLAPSAPCRRARCFPQSTQTMWVSLFGSKCSSHLKLEKRTVFLDVEGSSSLLSSNLALHLLAVWKR